ncbi:MAG: chemotaxis protein, partial [Sulfuricurvum sp.]|nr:chemotaxis protein [Sulfuricurvum sp.]
MMQFKSWTIRKRISLLVTMVLVSMLILFIFGYRQFSGILEESVSSGDTVALEIEYARSAQVEFKTQVQEWKNILIRGGDETSFKKYLSGFEKTHIKTLEEIKKLETLLNQEREHNREIIAKVALFYTAYGKLNSDYASALEIYRSSPPSDAHLIADKAVKGKDRESSAIIDEIVERVKTNAEEIKKVREKEQQRLLSELFGILLCVFLVNIWMAVALIRSINKAITMSVTTIRDGAMQITSASDQVASSSSSLAQGASEQASSVEEVSATLEESTAINSQNVDNARQADILAKNANDSARAGYEKGEQLSRSMHAITESAAKISGIIKAIDQIAF